VYCLRAEMSFRCRWAFPEEEKYLLDLLWSILQDHHFEFLLLYPMWRIGHCSLALSPWLCSHSREYLLLVCWKHIPFLVNFTVTFIESLHLAWILLLLNARTKVIFRTIFL
jgi:hypothetical protein